MRITQRTLAEVAACAYHGDGGSPPEGYHFVDKQVKISDTCFSTYINEVNKTAILAVRGSYSLHELKQSVAAGFDKITSGSARSIQTEVQKIWEEYLERFISLRSPEYEFYVSGHSYGGMIAQALAGEHNIKGASFNAPGIGKLTCPYPEVEFYNHIMASDLLSSVVNRSDHLGKKIIHKPAKCSSKGVFKRFEHKIRTHIVDPQKGTSHSLEYLLKHHFEKSCEDATDSCHC
ncbi:MAG: hypothetical protein ACI9S8_000667 [Chlamydiales bacterium]|jgi:hypothetical protein